MTFEQAKAQFVHRFAMEHKPTWANQPLSDGKFYAPQFRSDREWYDNTVFPPENGKRKYCTTSGQTWPLGMLLDEPFESR